MTKKLNPIEHSHQIMNAKRAAVAIFIVRALHIVNQMAGEGITIDGVPEPDQTALDMWRAFGEPEDEASDGFAVAIEVLHTLGLAMPHPDQVKTS